jgi:hypothetical protein
MIVVGRKLFLWWLVEIRSATTSTMDMWRRSPEWPLLVAAQGLLISFAVHGIGFRLARAGIIFAPTEWEGRTGWRKPVLFGISNAMVFCALAKALRMQGLVPRGAAAHAAAWGTVLEVGVITLQAWRGVASHFNTSSPLDAALYALKLVGVCVLAFVCLAAALGCTLKPSRGSSASDRAALRYGLLLLSFAICVGFAQLAYGHLIHRHHDNPRLPRPAVVDPRTENECLRVTANAHGAPCYEVYGEALLKILHFVPLHSTEPLLLLSWACTRAGLSDEQGLRHVRLAAAGMASLTTAALWQVARGGKLSLPGMARLDMETPAVAATAAGAFAIVWSFGAVALTPALARGEALERTKQA